MLHNWAGNFTYTAAHLHKPESIDDIIQLVKSCEKLRVLGTRHSFNAIADTPADLVSLDRFDRILSLDAAHRTVTVQPAVKYGDLANHLHTRGFAVHNLASLPHISVAGACATATHGSGVRNGNLATAVSAMEIITGGGDVISVSRQTHGDSFDGMVVHLGALGVITQMTLDIVPTFDVSQNIFEKLPKAELEQHFDEIVSSAYSVSLFTDWRTDFINQVWLKRIATDNQPPPTLFGATPAPADRHPIDGISAENCTSQMGIPGPWHERLPHFRMEFTPSSGEELQSEYFVPRDRAVEAFNAIAKLRDRISPLLFISEIRTIAADTLWMSPCYDRDCVAFHFTWKQHWPAVREVLPIIESSLAPFDVRPHWGKLFTIPADKLRSSYERFDDFREMLHSHDPGAQFRNPFLEEHLLSG